MKVILSRKGFDSANGGMPSLIMPNGDVVSMPIPSDDKIRYDSLCYGGKTYLEILRELRPRFSECECHLDPDLDSRRNKHCPIGWRPAFGQIGASSSYLMKTVGLQPGDLFLFFGNFRFVEVRNGRYCFMTRTGDFYRDKTIQLIWGYLQVEEIISNARRIRMEYPWHPHAMQCRLSDPSNILIVPTKSLSFADSRAGWGVLPFSEDRVLTKKNKNKATWKLNPVYMPDSIIGNRKNMSDVGVYYSGIWQELGLKESAAASQWAEKIVCI